jgi:hypothetical protein
MPWRIEARQLWRRGAVRGRRGATSTSRDRAAATGPVVCHVVAKLLAERFARFRRRLAKVLAHAMHAADLAQGTISRHGCFKIIKKVAARPGEGLDCIPDLFWDAH